MRLHLHVWSPWRETIRWGSWFDGRTGAGPIRGRVVTRSRSCLDASCRASRSRLVARIAGPQLVDEEPAA